MPVAVKAKSHGSGKDSQTTPVQIMHVFVFCCSTPTNLALYNFDSCKSLTTWCVLINLMQKHLQCTKVWSSKVESYLEVNT